MSRGKIKLTICALIMGTGALTGPFTKIVGPAVDYHGFEDGHRVEYRGRAPLATPKPAPHHYCGANPSLGFGPGETFDPSAPYGTYGNCKPLESR